MNKKVYSFIIILFLTLLSVVNLNAQNQLPKSFKVIPQPKDIILLEGEGLQYGGLKYLDLAGNIDRPIMGKILSLLPENGNNGKKLILRLVNDSNVPSSKEGYILVITNGNVEILSRGEAGLFYGCQTLEQLLEDSRDFNKPIPACKITDSPALAYRAVHFDVKHHLDHMNYYYESIDRLARYKINAVIFEFEDKLRYVRQPLVGAPQAISIDEMAALTQYAHDRHIEISPLVQGLGHATFILKHEEYAHLRELKFNRWAFCPLHEEAYEVLFDLYRDAMDATPGSRYLHVGGDEIGNIGICPRCKPYADREGMFELNLYWLNKVCEFVADNERIPIFWDDMPFKYAGLNETLYTRSTVGYDEAKAAWDTGQVILDNLIDKYPEECVFMRWNYSMARQPGNIMALNWYKTKGLKTMISTAANSGTSALFPFDERDNGMQSRGIAAIKSFVELASEKGIGGCLTTAWDDRSPHMETYWRGFLASAEYCWSPEQRSLDDFDKAYLQKEYGLSFDNYVHLYEKLREAAIFWEQAFMKKGSRLDLENALFTLPGLAQWMPAKETDESEGVDSSEILIELPDSQNPGKWSKRYADRIDEATKILKNYNVTAKALEELYLASKRNRYHWEVFSALNDFQITAPKLILALSKCDIKDSDEFEKVKSELNQVLDEFNQAWDKLNEVYSKTRFIEYPSDYVPDRYFHFASQREDLTWMIQVEELFHKQVNSWLSKNND